MTTFSRPFSRNYNALLVFEKKIRCMKMYLAILSLWATDILLGFQGKLDTSPKLQIIVLACIV